MLLHELWKNAIGDLERLIEITSLDMGDIMVANHDAIFSRLEAKNNAIAAFESNKRLIEAELRALVDKNPDKKIGELLDTAALELNDKMRQSLQTLQTLNKNYTRAALAVQEFYNSLVDEILPNARQGYSNEYRTKVDLLRVEA